MEIDIRRAAQEDLDAAEQLYNDVCSALEAGTNWPGWRQGVYPTRADARRAQAAGALYSTGSSPRSSACLRRGCVAVSEMTAW